MIDSKVFAPWLLVVLVCLYTPCAALDTLELRLRAGEEAPGAPAVIARDAMGNLVFSDAATSGTTLLQLMTLHGDHGAMENLEDDDHPHYLTAGRHHEAHGAAFNAAMAIPADVGGNSTLGAHVTDARFHLDREGVERIEGAWVFAGPLVALDGVAEWRVVSGLPAVRLGGEAGGVVAWDAGAGRLLLQPVVQSPTMVVGAVLDGLGTAALQNFATVEGIAPAHLLAANQGAVIVQPWRFEARLTAEQVVLDHEATVRLRALNGDETTLLRGERVRVVGRGAREIIVARAAADGTDGRNLPGGWMAAATASGDYGELVILGQADVLTTGSLTAGQALRWNGTAAEASGPEITGVVALEGPAEPGAVVRAWVGW